MKHIEYDINYLIIHILEKQDKIRFITWVTDERRNRSIQLLFIYTLLVYKVLRNEVNIIGVEFEI